MDEKRNAPLVVELPASDQDVTPETAPPIPEAGLDAGQRSTSFQATTLMLGRRPGRALRWAFGFFSAFVAMSMCLAIWEFLTGLIVRFPALGGWPLPYWWVPALRPWSWSARKSRPCAV